MRRGPYFDFYIDGYNEMTSTWLRWINCARHFKEQNVSFQACRGKAFYITSKDIYPGQELLIYYGHNYAKTLHIDTNRYKDRSVNVDWYKKYACWAIE